MCKRADVYYVDLGKREGSVQGGIRPFVITQNDMGNKFSPTVHGYSITSSKSKKPLPTHVNLTTIDGMALDSHIVCEQPFTISKSELKEKITTLSDEKMKEVDRAIKISSGIKEINEPKIQPDRILMDEMLEVLKSKKINSKTMLTMFVRYCDSFNLDYKEYISSLV